MLPDQAGGHKVGPCPKKNNRNDEQDEEYIEFRAGRDQFVLVGWLLRKEEEEDGDNQSDDADGKHSHAGSKRITGPLNLSMRRLG